MLNKGLLVKRLRARIVDANKGAEEALQEGNDVLNYAKISVAVSYALLISELNAGEYDLK